MHRLTRHAIPLRFLFSAGLAIGAAACLPGSGQEDRQGRDTIVIDTAAAALTAAEIDMVAFQTAAVVDAEVIARGDFDGDGTDEYAVGDWRYDDGTTWNAGRVLIYPASGCGEVPHHTPAQEWLAGGSGLPGAPVLQGRFGYALTAADFNGDGYDDLAIGMPGLAGTAQTYGGAAFVIYGSGSGLSATGAYHLSQNAPGIQGVTEGGDGFGHAVTSADFDNDGFDDLALGVPFEGRWGHSQTGAVQVVFGSASGLNGSGDLLIDRETTDIAGVAAPGDRFGYSVAAGRFSSSSPYPGLAISVPKADDAATNAGAVHVLPGSSGGPTGSGSLRVHENYWGIASAASQGEYFGHSLEVRDDDRDGADDLLIRNLYASDCSEAATHLLYGSDSGITTAGDEYQCGTATAPRFAISVEPPDRPSAYVPPAGEPVSDVALLRTLLTNGVPDVIILEDGVYDDDSYVVPDAADEIWARHVGAAILRFGIYYQFKDWQDHEQPEIHGLTFDMAEVDYDRVISVGTTNAAIVQAGVVDGGSGVPLAMSLVVEDTFFYGHEWIDTALRVQRPDEVALRRLVVRDTHDAGIYVTNTNSGNAPSPTVTIEDVDIAGVAKPPGEAGTHPDYPGPNYFCNSETGLTVDRIDELQLHRIRVRDTRCAGINLGVNRYEASVDAGQATDLDIDCTGLDGATLTDADDYRPVRNAALYLQYTSSLEIGHVVVGPQTHDGLRTEYTAGESSEADVLHHALLQAQRTGISWDACSVDMVAADSVIEGATCAGVVDYQVNNDTKVADCGGGGLAGPNAITGVTFRLPKGVPDVMTSNANTCPALPNPG
jgi:FG-GAP repeat